MASTPAPITEGRPGAYRWYVLGLLTLTSAFSVADRLVFGILVQDIKAEFSLSDFELGLLGGLAFSLVYVLAGFPAARLADEENLRRGQPQRYQHRGTIAYLMTLNGPEPLEYRRSAIDYEHYIDKQLRPIADAILPFIGESFDRICGQQLDLF